MAGIPMIVPATVKLKMMIIATINALGISILNSGFWVLNSFSSNRFNSFMVIRFSVQDSKCAVDLFGQKKPNHLVRESHVGKRKFAVGTLVNCFRKSVRSADEKNDLFHRLVHEVLDFVGKLRRIHLFTEFVQQNYIIGRLQFRKEGFSFFIFLLLL